ncbi:BZ3500_MvSof-1268-A1-R1_Chr7-1g09224 [Microbotryum saponariae]|uniref:BZ3500_MvSof-1268-A1-R1_Chr7-1g09224 protein n=1 Tax=Microbotryum saponariae TaxID=289078 RepID=A0A2X0LBG2_9BASI|nr:BZ3501_MvSof-1269-A2-R1_Chr7-1g08929 [Microbotryum saponariae]SDA03029.1 BZ3500_MvSof-1268-A1-R1_Chr7-1g09224 [Microbotryum saponariae]
MSDTAADEIRAAQAARREAKRAAQATQRPESESNKVSMSSVSMDLDVYDGVSKGSRFAKHDLSISAGPSTNEDDEQLDEYGNPKPVRLLDSFTAPKHLINEFADDDAEDPFAATAKSRQVTSRQSEYHARRFNRESAVQADAFAMDDAPKTGGDDESTTYADQMRRAEIEREEQRVQRAIQKKQEEAAVAGTSESTESAVTAPDETPRGRQSWDVDEDDRPRASMVDALESGGTKRSGEWDDVNTQGKEAAAAAAAPKKKRSRWDETPAQAATAGSGAPGETPRRSRWDQTPVGVAQTPSAASLFGAMTPFNGATGSNASIPGAGQLIDPRNRYLSDEELNQMLPTEGYEIVDPPAGYAPIRTPARKLQETPMAMNGGGFIMQEDAASASMLGITQELPTEIAGVGDLQFFKQEDATYFAKILGDQDESELSIEELKERKIMRLLLKIKNGTPPMRKTALRQITDKAREFGAGPLFDKILPLLMERTLEDQERHLLVKVIDRVLYKLDDLVRPYVHKILVVIEPLLIDEDYYARVEGREIISNLSKAAGLAHMISTMRPDIDHADEYVRNTTARAFSVVASALGIPSLLPFLKAVCRSKKSWQARHTGIKIIQQIAIMMGCAVLPHLKNLVEAVAHGLEDEQQKVRTMTALCIAALAEAAAPYGIESFDSVLKPLWTGIRKHRGKGLAAFLKAIGFIIPLMDPEYANYYTREVMVILIREFQSPDEEMKKIVLKVVKQCAGTDGVQPAYVKEEILPEFFKNFMVRRMALDRRNYRQVVETTVELAQKAGVSEIVGRIVNDLKDESEPYRKMVMDIITQVVAGLGAADIDERLEVQLIDGIIYAFQEQSAEDYVMLEGFGTVVNALGIRVKPYLTQIVSTILWRLNNKSAKVRQQAADLTTKLAVVIKQCEEDALLSKLGVVLFEQLGEEYPDTLGSIIAAIAAIANVVGMTQMSPPVKDLLPRMTPILRNRHEKVQEASINLIGRIADRGAEFVSAREWMRICFELLDLLKAHKKAIRRAAVNSFGYIAKAIGPQDVLSVLLTNLRVQERQSRVCSTVAIAIVAETCGPFTCIPAILNEYRTPELNVRNGCLKAMSFLFEYIGEMGKDYIHSVVTCLEDALTDRDLVHRQTSATIVKHLALGTAGLGDEDACLHLLNLLWPNIFETSPHVIGAVLDAIEAMRIALGPGVLLSYIMQGLWHPARRVREVYWQIYSSLYMGAQDALVPYYPTIPEISDERNDYEGRSQLLMMWV